MTFTRRPTSSGAGQAVSGSLVIGDLVMVSGVTGDVTITPFRPSYRVEPFDVAAPLSIEQARAQPSRLLLARHEVVPFTGREQQLSDLTEWLGQPGGLAVRLIHATGGQGKTRLARHLAAHCAQTGWMVWRVLHTPAPTAVSRVALPVGAGVLAVVDYADRWPLSDLLALLTHLHTLHLRTSTTVRALMVARSAGFWWHTLHSRVDGDLGVPATAQELPPLGAETDRGRLFRSARRRFAEAMAVTGAGELPVLPVLCTDDTFAQVLAIHMAALVAVDAHRHGQATPAAPHALSAYLLRREYAHWHALHARTEDRKLTSPATMGRTAYVATLTGAMVRAEAHRVLRRVRLTEPGVDNILDDHRFCYPPEDGRTVLQPMHPDRLGEDFLALTTPGGDRINDDGWRPDDWAEDAVHNLFANTEGDPPTWAPGAVAVLVETAHRWTHMATDVLYPLLKQRPDLAIAAGGATLTRLAAIEGIDPAVLDAIDARLPAGGHVDLDVAAAAITTVLTAQRLAVTTDPAVRARLHATHAWRLGNAGHHQQALAPAVEAVNVSRRLAEANPAVFESDLASALRQLGATLSRLGRREEAFAAAVEAADLYRRSAEANPVVFEPDLASALDQLGKTLSDLGRREEGLTATTEAVGVYRRLAELDPAVAEANLALALNNLGMTLSDLGRRQEGLTAMTEAVGRYRRLAEGDPAAREPDLALALNNLGVVLWNLGQRDQALAAATEAVEIRRRLAGTNPTAYEPDLAVALNNLSVDLADVGRWADALAATSEAVEIHRRLASINPAAHEPDLAVALNNLGHRLSKSGRRVDALAATSEAVEIHRRLANAYPAAFEPDLATVLNNLSVDLSNMGRWADALAATSEAVEIHRRLASINPAAHEPHLASALGNLGGGMWKLRRLAEGLAATAEAVEVYRRLANTNPAAYEPELASAVHNLAVMLSNTGRREEGLAATTEAVEIRRRLADANQAAYEPDLAMGLNNLGNRLSEFGRLEEALATTAQAVEIRRRLASTNPAAYEPDLAATLSNLGKRLAELGRGAEALAAAIEAVEIRRRLASTNPAAYEPDLAEGLCEFAGVCHRVSLDLPEALTALHEAIGIYQRLIERLPEAFTADLRQARRILADVLDGLGRSAEAAKLRNQLADA